MSDIDATADGDATVIPPLPGPPAPGNGTRRARRWPMVVLVLVALLIATGLVLEHHSVNDYSITPGDAIPVTPFIDVPAADDHKLDGTILLTDVYVTQLNTLTYLETRYFNSDSQIYSSAELLGPSTPAAQYVDQSYLDMSQAQSDATAAALTHLGYAVSGENAGALVYGIAPGSPAAADLKLAQVITKVNGTPVSTDCGLVDSLHGLTPDTDVTLAVEQSSINGSGVFERGAVIDKTVKLAAPPKGLEVTGCGAPLRPTAYLGIQPETQYNWNFPVKVTVHTVDIGGPSAGLSMTLGIIDKLSGGDLTGRRIVAATGTINAQGDVGDVGGVPEKTIAVERAGATVFLVPPQELKAARSKATPQLHVYAVSNLNQALRILTHLGGKVSPKHQTVQAAP
jgi:PDZ domain-containing protein